MRFARFAAAWHESLGSARPIMTGCLAERSPAGQDFVCSNAVSMAYVHAKSCFMTITGLSLMGQQCFLLFSLRDSSRLSFERCACRLAVARPVAMASHPLLCFCDGCTCWLYGPSWMAVVWVRAFLWRVEKCLHAAWRRGGLFFSGVRRSFGWVSILHMAPVRTMRRAQP